MQSVTRQQLAEIIGKQTLAEADPNKLAQAVAEYLSSEHKSLDVNILMRDIMQYRIENGVVEAVVVSAHELSPTVLADIKDLLYHHFPNATSVMVSSRVDESLVGGIRIELPQETLDLSVKSKLNLFKRLVTEEN